MRFFSFDQVISLLAAEEAAAIIKMRDNDENDHGGLVSFPNRLGADREIDEYDELMS